MAAAGIIIILGVKWGNHVFHVYVKCSELKGVQDVHGKPVSNVNKKESTQEENDARTAAAAPTGSNVN